MARKGLISKSFTHEGKRYYVTGKTEKEALMKLANKMRDLEEGKIVVSGNMTVATWAEQAVETYKTRQKEITKQKYVARMRHCILEHIGSMQLKSVKPIDCQRVLNLQAGKSKTQINEVYLTLQFIFRTAYENQLIVKNPAEHLVRPLGYKNSRRAITDHEREHLMKVCQEDPQMNIFMFMLKCGCRPSEARALKGTDLIKIQGKTMLHIRGTKTEKSDRIVPCPVDLYEMYHGIDDILFKTQTGKPYEQKNYFNLLEALYRKMNISMGVQTYRGHLIEPLLLAEDFTPYCLRHTYCSDLQKKGIDIRTAQYLMGHSDIKMTANIYTHVDQSVVLSAADILLA